MTRKSYMALVRRQRAAFRRRGRDAGYPECCIRFFIHVWAPLFDLLWEQRTAGGRDFLAYLHVTRHQHAPGYIPCPACHLDASVHQTEKRIRRSARGAAR